MSAGLKITTLHELQLCARDKTSVIGAATGNKPSPASFWMHRQARAVLKAIEDGLYTYEPKQKPAFNTKRKNK